MADNYHMTQAEYAKHRGISQPRIAKLISQGKLDGAYIKKGRRYIINPEDADRLMESNRDPIHDARIRPKRPRIEPASKTPAPSGEGKSLNEAARLNMWYRAALLKIKYEKEVGALISKDKVTKQAAHMGALIKTHLESLPAKLGQELAGINEPKQVAQLLRREIKSALTALGNEIAKL
jgi:hypothetical protein